jgi:hypothetical protein
MVGTGGGAEAAVRRWVEAGGGRLVLDGGLATELEANGADLNDPLWSAKCLLGAPHLIRKASSCPPNNSAPVSFHFISFHRRVIPSTFSFRPVRFTYYRALISVPRNALGQGTAGSSQGI